MELNESEGGDGLGTRALDNPGTRKAIYAFNFRILSLANSIVGSISRAIS